MLQNMSDHLASTSVEVTPLDIFKENSTHILAVFMATNTR